MATYGASGVVLPVYLLIDVSYSAAGYLDQLRQGLVESSERISMEPVIADMVRMSVITFSDTAELACPLTPLSGIPSLQAFSPRGGTSYSEAFKLAAVRVVDDVRKLKEERRGVRRPIVMFVTDGEPTDDSATYMQALAGLKRLPVTIISVGLGSSVDAQILSEVASAPGLAFVTAVETRDAEQWQAPATLLQTLLAATSASVSAATAVVSAAVPEGLVSVTAGDSLDWL